MRSPYRRSPYVRSDYRRRSPYRRSPYRRSHNQKRSHYRGGSHTPHLRVLSGLSTLDKEYEKDKSGIISSPIIVCNKKLYNKELQSKFMNRILDREYPIENIQLRLSQTNHTKSITLLNLDIDDIPNNITLHLTKMLGEGSYGKVLLFYDEETKLKLSLKIEKNEIITEENISDILYKDGCNTVNVRLIHSENINEDEKKNIYLMNPLEGDLDKLLKKISKIKNETVLKNIKLDIVREIQKQILCLFKLGFVYTDLKLGNILYDCYSDGSKFNIYLGDLGSAVPDKEGDYLSSFPPIEKKEWAFTN